MRVNSTHRHSMRSGAVVDPGRKRFGARPGGERIPVAEDESAL